MVALQLARQLADALAHAHDAGVVHGALTAASVRIHRGGAPRALLAAFATATLVPRTPQLTRYLAPERLAGADADVSGDVFALGLIVFEMLEGKPFFERADEIADPKGPFLPRFSSIAPAGVSALVARAIRRSPAARQQSMAQLRDEIDECLRRHGQSTLEARDRRASGSAIAAGAGIAFDESLVRTGGEAEPDGQHASHARVTQRAVAPRMRVKVAAPPDEPEVPERFVTSPAARPKAPVLPGFFIGVAVGSLQTLAAVGLVLWLWPMTRTTEKIPTLEIVSSEPGPATVDPAHEAPATEPPAPNRSSEEAVPEVASQPAPESPDEDATPTKAAPSNGTTGSRPTEAGVREWLRNLASAWEAKDMKALRALGIGDTDVEAEAIRTRLARQTGRVSIAKLEIFIGRMYARVAFNLVTSNGRGKRVARSETYQLERLPNGSIVRRHE
jgi:serine/threonine protein kinase